MLLNNEEIQYEIDYVIEHNDWPLEVLVKPLVKSIAKAQLKKVKELENNAIYINDNEGWFLKNGWENNATHICIPIDEWQSLLKEIE